MSVHASASAKATTMWRPDPAQSSGWGAGGRWRFLAEAEPTGLDRGGDAARRPIGAKPRRLRQKDGVLPARLHEAVSLPLGWWSSTWRTAMGTKKPRQLPPDLVRGRSRFQAWRTQR